MKKPMTGGIRISNFRKALLGMAAAATMTSVPALAQDEDADISPPRLPRPGYDYDGIQRGNTTILAQTDLRIDYASNLFRTSENEQEDIRAVVRPSLAVTQRVSTGSITAEAHGGFTRHLDTTRENSNTYGASLGVGLAPSRGRVFEALVGYDRNIERRGDPETSIGPTDLPRQIDVFLAEASYRHAVGDIRLGLGIGVEKFDLLDPLDDDRDQTAYRASLKIGYNVSPSLDVYVEPFVNRRDFRLPVDFGGVDRDANTYGVLAGVERDLGNRLRGNLGIGLFQTDPEGDIVPAYLGVRVSAAVTWIPRQRTAVNFRLERGNAATVRSGATTRVDTIARVRVDQEIRKNLLGFAAVSYIDRYFLGESRGNLRNVGGRVGLEYLIDRRFSVYTSAAYIDRSALADIDKYTSFVFSIGIRSRL